MNATDDVATDIDRQPGDSNTSTIEPVDSTGQEDTAEPTVETEDSTAKQTRNNNDIHVSASGETDHSHVSFIFRDGLDIPLSGLDFIVTLPSGLVCTAKSTSQGAITVPVINDKSGQARVEVKDETGLHQQVCSVDLVRCKNAAIIRSPKVKAVLPLRPHQQTAPATPASTNAPVTSADKLVAPNHTTKSESQEKDNPSEPWWSANGALAQAWNRFIGSSVASGKPPAKPATTPLAGKTLNSAGQPVAIVAGPECPNPDALKLGQKNNRYRAAILDASKRLGLIPQAICALIDCEAGKVPEKVPKLDPQGKPLKDKKGKVVIAVISELWNANAGNPQSGAAGLTQFLASTWLNHIMLPGYYIHDKCVAKGWVRQEASPKGGKHWVFILTDGKTTTSPYSKRNGDANVQACLAMRMDPVWSINAAADYGAANLKVLEKAGFKLSTLNDMDKAKLMYLMHHEGEGAGPAFIRNTLGSLKGGTEGLKKKFATQLGTNGVDKANEQILQAAGDVEKAYRRWLGKFIDGNFTKAERFFCSNPKKISELSDLMEDVGGQPL